MSTTINNPTIKPGWADADMSIVSMSIVAGVKKNAMPQGNNGESDLFELVHRDARDLTLTVWLAP